MKDQSKWLDYVESQIGFVLPSSQLLWLENAVLATAKRHNLTVDELWLSIKKIDLINKDLLDSVLITESRFFRHKPSMDFVKSQAKERFQSNTDKPYASKDQFRVWSVGCSSGQEVWSLAMSLSSLCIENFRILGTDISSVAVEAAKKGVYPKRYLTDIPSSCLHFTKDIKQPLDVVIGTQSNKWEVATELRPHVLFASHNIFLMASNAELVPEYLQVQYDIIYCQNMLIYFRQFDQRDILSRLVSQCKVGGHIVLAPNEGYFWKHPHMRRIDSEYINAWQKIK